ncbi:uncharacterized protein LOC116348241 [Contarinia nasturtii]|uniref:uncharacterized protein LOC116348241 n=1 Tax=Contarinia nasturtii TaxID=265458 RepID=UPI0012D38544|nr:uncharacterized protein LOC116348241 [Contarinia nasturtii]
MPFVWDDFEALLLDDEEPYDEQQFVVVRKLHIRPIAAAFKPLPIPEYTVDQMNVLLRKFGDIESIEMVANKTSEAYVTFVSDRNAYLAYLQCKYSKKDGARQRFDVQPANTWEQPQERTNDASFQNDMDVDKYNPEIFALNEDCLLHMCKFLDLDSLVSLAYVCKKFHTLLHQRWFPNIRKYVLKNEGVRTLAKVRRTMLCIGRHITDLSYESDYDEEVNRTPKYLEVIAQNVGPQIRRAYLSLEFNRDDCISILKPMLQHLESLRVNDFNEDQPTYDIDFHALCPNLVEFEVNVEMPMIACCKPWSSLKCISVPPWTMKTKTFISFIKQNPQLTSLHFDLPETNKRIVAVNTYLPALEKLSIRFRSSITLVAKNFACLNGQKLSEIKVTDLSSEQIQSVISHLSTFKSLRKICVSMSSSNSINSCSESLINLAKLPHLIDLTLSYISFDGSTLLDIIRFGCQLGTLYIENDVLIFTDELISNIVEVCKNHRPSSSGALHLYLRKYVLTKLHVYQNKEFERYLQLKVWARI